MTKSSAATFRLVSSGALALALLAALAWWMMRSSPSDAMTAVPVAARSIAAPGHEELAPLTSVAPREQEVAPTKSTPAPDSVAKPTAAEPSNETLEVQFDLKRPDWTDVVVPRAEIDVTLADGTHQRATIVEGSQAVTRLPKGIGTVRVQAAGFLHREQTIDVEPDPNLRGLSGGPPQVERIVLWPNGKEWIAVVVETKDGRPFQALAEDLKIEPKRLFVGAFDVRARMSAPIDGVPFETEKEHIATFHPPPGYQRFDFPGGVVGRLELERDPPMWVELLVFGAPVAVEMIRPGDQEVVFHLDQAAYDAACARVKLRVVDARTHTPLPDARVTLRADTSAHRRKEQENSAPDGGGRVEFTRVLPGKYELTVTRGDDLDQRRIEVAAKQVLDVGDVALEQRGHIDVLVVDEQDRPASAYVEIAPFEPKKRVDELYPPMLYWSCDSYGKIRLPLPAKTSIVRARVAIGTSNGQPADGARTANLLIDPEKLPPQPWKIVLREPVSTSFQVGLRDVTTVEVQDELGIVDAWPKLDAQGKATCDLVPGRHKARYLDASGNARNEQDFVVAKDSGVVRGP